MKKLILIFIILFHANILYAQLITDIAKDKVLTEEEKVVVKEELKGKIFKTLTPTVNDYKDKHNRGTVEYKESWKNYAWYKVKIKDGSIVRNKNFAQRNAHTVAIEGKDLTFIYCNLENVEIDPSWTLINTRHLHTRESSFVVDEVTYYKYEREIKPNVWEEIHTDIDPVFDD